MSHRFYNCHAHCFTYDHVPEYFLTMDMEYMGAGRPKKKFEEQLKELEEIKRRPEWQQLIYPFIFCDPRRIEPSGKKEVDVESDFISKKFLDKVENYIEQKIFQG